MRAELDPDNFVNLEVGGLLRRHYAGVRACVRTRVPTLRRSPWTLERVSLCLAVLRCAALPSLLAGCVAVRAQ